MPRCCRGIVRSLLKNPAIQPADAERMSRLSNPPEP